MRKDRDGFMSFLAEDIEVFYDRFSVIRGRRMVRSALASVVGRPSRVHRELVPGRSKSTRSPPAPSPFGPPPVGALVACAAEPTAAGRQHAPAFFPRCSAGVYVASSYLLATAEPLCRLGTA